MAKQQPILFTLISITKGRVNLNYKKSTQDNLYTNFSIDCPEQPAPEFVEAMNLLKPALLNFCEQQPGPEEEEKTEVRSLHFDYEDDNKTVGVIVSGIKKYSKSNGVLPLNTPRKIFSSPEIDSKESKVLLDEDTYILVQAIINEAIKYLGGERAQGDLFKEQPADNKKKNKDQEILIS